MDIDGVWRGRYSYGSGYPSTKEDVPFELELRKTGPIQLGGVVRDDPRFGMPEEGRIQGWTLLGWLFFVKRMPVSYFTAPDGFTQRLSDLIFRQNGVSPVREIPHVIYYSGRYRATDRSFTGTWRIRASRIQVDCGVAVVVVTTAGTAGTWNMQRSEPSS